MLTGTGRGQLRRPGDRRSRSSSPALACALRRPLLRRIRGHDPDRRVAPTPTATPRWASSFAWIIGWDLILEYLFARLDGRGGLVGIRGLVPQGPRASTSRRNTPRRPTPTPRRPTPASTSGGSSPRAGSATGAVLNLPAMFIVVLITILLIIGISESATFNNVIVVIKVTVVLLFIALRRGVHQRATTGSRSFRRSRAPGKFGWDGIVRGAGVIFFAYIGFDAVSTAAQEAKNPQRDMPIGILGSLAICTVLYIAVALVLTGIVHYTELNVPDPIAVGINAAGPALAWLAPDRQDRRDRRPVLGHPGDAAGPAAHLLHDVEGRPAAAGLQRGASQVPDAVARQRRHRRRWRWRSPASSRSGSWASWCRSARCSRSRSSAPACWCCATPIPTGRARSGRRWSRSCRFSGILACVYLMLGLPVDTWARLDRLDGARPGDLLPLRPAALEGAAGGEGSAMRKQGQRRSHHRERSEGSSRTGSIAAEQVLGRFAPLGMTYLPSSAVPPSRRPAVPPSTVRRPPSHRHYLPHHALLSPPRPDRGRPGLRRQVSIPANGSASPPT